MAKRNRKRKSAKSKPNVSPEQVAANDTVDAAAACEVPVAAASAEDAGPDEQLHEEQGAAEAGVESAVAAEPPTPESEPSANGDAAATRVEATVAEATEAASDTAATSAEATIEPADSAFAAAAAATDASAKLDVASVPAAPVFDPESPEGKLMAKLQRLRERGAANFDWVGLDHAERLIQRGHALGGDAGKHLLRRADSYLADYAGRFKATRRKTRLEADRLARLGLVPLRETHKRLERGDWQRLRQLARKHPEQELRLRDRLSEQWQAALGAEAEKRGLTSPGMIETPSDEELERTRTMGLALALYRDAAASAHAAMAIAKAVDSLPIEAGRYHATSVATRALQAMQDVPSYLRAQLNRLELLSLMETFGAPAISAQEDPQKGNEKKTSKRAPKRSQRAPASRGARKPRPDEGAPEEGKTAVAS